MRKLVLIIAVAGFGFCQAQDNATKKLTFKEAVQIGLQNNLNLNQQKNLLVASKVNKTFNLLSMGPTVNASASAGTNSGNNFIPQKGIITGVSDNIGLTISAGVPIFGGFSALNAFRQSASQYEAQLHFVNRTSQDVIRDVSRLYLTCLLDRQLVMISEKNVETQQTQFNQIQEFVNVGTRAEVDLENQDYQLKNAQLLMLRAQNTLRNDLALLAQALQLDPSIPIELEEPDWSVENLDGVMLEDMYQLANEKRSDLKRAEANESAAEYGYKSMKGNYFPQLSAYAQLQTAYVVIHPNEVDPNPENRPFADQFQNDNRRTGYGLSLQIPIYGAFQTRSNAVRNRALYQNAKLQTENTELTIKSEVLLAYQNFKDAQAAFGAASAQLDAATKSNALEKERYALGISDIVALTTSNQTLTRAQSDYANARYTLMFQQLLINYATGTLKFEDIP
jgi:outer membrane protein